MENFYNKILSLDIFHRWFSYSFVKGILVIVLAVFIISCSAFKDDKNKTKKAPDLTPDENITEDFNGALSELVSDVTEAVDVNIDPEHFDYLAANITLSVSSINSHFDRFKVGIKYIQLVDDQGFVFTLYDYNHTESLLMLDFAELMHKNQLLLFHPKVPAGIYNSLLIEFDFNDIVVKSWENNILKKTYLLSDEARNFQEDQVSYRISVDLGADPMILAANSYQHIHTELNIDESIKHLQPIENSIADKSDANLKMFHPALDVQQLSHDAEFFVSGNFNAINDIHISLTPFDFIGHERYINYFNNVKFNIDESTQFFINGKLENFSQANILLAPKNDGYVRVEGTLSKTDTFVFKITHLYYVNTSEFDLSSENSLFKTITPTLSSLAGSIKAIQGDIITLEPIAQNYLTATPTIRTVEMEHFDVISVGDYVSFYGYMSGKKLNAIDFRVFSYDNASISSWLDELPPNETLNKMFKGKSDLDKIDAEGLKENASVVYKRDVYMASNVDVNSIDLTNTPKFYLQSYTTFNPHISKYDSLEELLDALSKMIEEGAHIYSLVYRGQLSTNQLASDAENDNYFKVRIRGRWLETELSRAMFDEDIHGERTWLGLTPTQIAAIGGSAIALAIVGAILGSKLKKRIQAPGFCKGSSSVSQCLTKLDKFDEYESDFYKYGRQINPDALAFDGEDGKYSSLAVLRKKYLNDKGAEAFRAKGGQEKLEKILNASKRLNQVFSKKTGVFSLLSPTQSYIKSIRRDVSPSASKDNKVYSKFIDLDTRFQSKVIDFINNEVDFNEDKQEKFKKAIDAVAKIQKNAKGSSTWFPIVGTVETKESKAVELDVLFKEFNKNMELGDSKGINSSGDDEQTDGKVKPSILSPDDEIISNIQSLKSSEEAYAKFKVDPTPENMKVLFSSMNMPDAKETIAISFNDSGELEKDVDKNIKKALDQFRDGIDKKNNEFIKHKMEALDALQKKGIVTNTKFINLTGEMLIDEALTEQVKRVVLTVELDTTDNTDKTVNVSELEKRVKTLRKDILSSSKGGDKPRNLIGDDGSIFDKIKSTMEGDLDGIRKTKSGKR